MNDDQPFDKKIRFWNDRVSPEFQQSAVLVTNTLDLCWASAKAIFKEKATPECAFEIYDRILELIDQEEENNFYFDGEDS